MKTLKCTKAFALIGMLLGATPMIAQDNVIDEVVWVVGDEAILKSDVESERLNAQYEGRKFDGDPYCVIPEQLAIQKLFLHQAAIDSVEVSDQEVLERVESQTRWLIEQIGSKEKMEEYYNKTSTQIREMLRENIRDGLTVQKMQQKSRATSRWCPPRCAATSRTCPPTVSLISPRRWRCRLSPWNPRFRRRKSTA
jgi:peptidyl-prolyl cis-trans isomerase SurA